MRALCVLFCPVSGGGGGDGTVSGAMQHTNTEPCLTLQSFITSEGRRAPAENIQPPGPRGCSPSLLLTCHLSLASSHFNPRPHILTSSSPHSPFQLPPSLLFPASLPSPLLLLFSSSPKSVPPSFPSFVLLSWPPLCTAAPM